MERQRIDPQLDFRWGGNELKSGLARIVRWTGYLRIPRAGRYDFGIKLNGDLKFVGMARMRIGERWVFGNAKHFVFGQAEKPVTAFTALKAGLHPVHIEFIWEQPSRKRFILSWGFDGSRKQVIPKAVFFHGPKNLSPLVSKNSTEHP